MGARYRVLVASGALLLGVVLAGCGGSPGVDEPEAPGAEPAAEPVADGSGDDVTTGADGDGSGASGSGEFLVDPAWPWPDVLPRPDAPIASEFTSANPMGEGGIYSIEFTVASVDEVQAYADELGAAGIEWVLDGVLAEAEEGDGELAVVGMSETYMLSLTVDTTTLLASFNLMGTFE